MILLCVKLCLCCANFSFVHIGGAFCFLGLNRELQIEGSNVLCYELCLYKASEWDYFLTCMMNSKFCATKAQY